MNINMVLDHLFIVLVSVLITIGLGVPIGIWAYLSKRFRRVILRVVELLQTVPALALLGLIMIVLGAGKPTVITGLILYSLLPVVQNTYLGLEEVDPGIREVARGMGMTKRYRLLRVELPLASPYIFSGIRLATVTAVGVAVFGTFVGGGGLGRPIYQGIRVSNAGLILSSTLSLVVMAVSLDFIMAVIEKRLYRRFLPATVS